MNTGLWKFPLLCHPGRKHRAKGYFLRIKKKKEKKSYRYFMQVMGVSKGNAWVPLKALEKKKKRRAFIFFVFFFLSLSE